MDNFEDFPLHEEYEQITEFGKGRFGRVLSYQNKKDSRKKVAVKVCTIANKRLDYFYRELKALRLAFRQRHPNIAKLIGYCKDQSESIVYIVLKLYKCDLEKFQENHHERRFSIKDIEVLYPQFISALAFLHSINIAHRDLKLANILLDYTTTTPHKNIKDVLLILTDFGLSRPVGEKSTNSKYSLVGNEKHAAPEVLQLINENDESQGNPTKNAHYDPKKADIYSSGTILYYMLKGNDDYKIFEEKSLEDKSNLYLHCNIKDNRILWLLQVMLKFKPEKRPNIEVILNFMEHFFTMTKLPSLVDKSNQQCRQSNKQEKLVRAKNHIMIVLVGPRQSGKTSTALHLLGKPKSHNILGSEKLSSTKASSEYLIYPKVTDDELSQDSLSIVDTPGMTGNSNHDQDAKNMANIEEFLSKNEYLNTANRVQKYPDIVLLTVKGDESFDHHSLFVKCIHQLFHSDLLLTDGSNLIIVLAHAWKIFNDKNEFREKVNELIDRIKNFVKRLTNKWDVPVVILENIPPSSMKAIDDGGCWTQFPGSRVLQPKNLLDCIINKVLRPNANESGIDTIRKFFSEGTNSEFHVSLLNTLEAIKKPKGERNDREQKYYKYIDDFDPISLEEEKEEEEEAVEE